MSKSQKVVLETRRISKTFGNIAALQNVSVKFYSGTVNTVVGENGAGKSTLMNILSGVYQDYKGEIYLDDKLVQFSNPKEAINCGIAMIHQELNLIPDLSITENIYLGREIKNRIGLINYKKMYALTKKLLERLNLKVHPKQKVAELRVGEQQVVEIAKALSLKSRVIIMDEPTSAISDQEINLLFDIIRSLKSRGVAIIYITHKMDELFQIGDYVIAFRDGRFIDTSLLSKVTKNDVVRMMIGRDIKDFFVKVDTNFGKDVLEVENIKLQNRDRKEVYLLDDINFSVRKGEVLGIYGLMGAGRTELFETIFGLYPKTSSGKIFIDEEEVQINSPNDAINAGLGLVPEDRKDAGLVMAMNIASNINLSCMDQIEGFLFINKHTEKFITNMFIKRLKIRAPSIWETVQNLSGGNQQKVVIAKWLATNPKVLFLDEPTRGIDVNAKNEIYNLIADLAAKGMGIVLVSSELPEIMAISDRIMVLSEGKQRKAFSAKEITEEKIIHEALPKSI